MTTETTSGAGLVTWTTSVDDPCLLLWRSNKPRARWQVYAPRCDTPQEAAELARYYGRTNFIPITPPAAQRRGRKAQR